MNFLLSIDHSLFAIIAVTLKNRFFDVIMPVLSDAKAWRIPLVGLWLGFLLFGKKKGIKTAILCLVAVALSDFICGSVLQPLVGRPRPLGGITHSFPSCHAANMFAAATVIAYYWRKYWVWLTAYGIAVAVAYSRIYTTSHYPSDVSAGAFFGICFASIAILLYNAGEKYYLKKKTKSSRLRSSL